MKFVLQLIIIVSLGLFTAQCTQSGSGSNGNKGQVASQTNGSYSEANVSAFEKMIQDKSGKLLDVRTPEEFAEGHLAGAMNIDIMADNFRDKVSKLPKDSTYLVYCYSGQRAAEAGKADHGRIRDHERPHHFRQTGHP